MRLEKFRESHLSTFLYIYFHPPPPFAHHFPPVPLVYLAPGPSGVPLTTLSGSYTTREQQRSNTHISDRPLPLRLLLDRLIPGTRVLYPRWCYRGGATGTVPHRTLICHVRMVSNLNSVLQRCYTAWRPTLRVGTEHPRWEGIHCRGHSPRPRPSLRHTRMFPRR